MAFHQPITENKIPCTGSTNPLGSTSDREEIFDDDLSRQLDPGDHDPRSAPVGGEAE
jgi:hypothetical protein